MCNLCFKNINYNARSAVLILCNQEDLILKFPIFFYYFCLTSILLSVKFFSLEKNIYRQSCKMFVKGQTLLLTGPVCFSLLLGFICSQHTKHRVDNLRGVLHVETAIAHVEALKIPLKRLQWCSRSDVILFP